MKNRPAGRDTTANSRRSTRAANRAAARQAAARRATLRRRQRIAGGVLAGLAAVGLIVAAVYAWGGSEPADQAAPAPSATASSAVTTPATGPDGAVAFPPVPDGADPALATKPATGAGTGALTKLTVTTLIEGGGAPTAAGQQIAVNYVGVSYSTGEEFDSSWTRSQPFTFTLGQGRVIKGWDQGLVGVKVGSRVQLDIPADLAYGDDAAGGAPSGPLRFVVDVLSAG